MVFAASTMRIPAALTEADAHLGLANRLAAPFARRLFLSYPLETRHRHEGAGRRPADPGALDGRSRRPRRARSSSCPAEGPILGVFGALAGARALNEFVVDTWGAGRPADPARHRAPRLRPRPAPRAARRLPRRAGDGAVRRRALGRRPRARTLGLDRLGDRRGRPARRSSCRTRSRPATTRRRTPSTSSRAGGAIMVRELDLDDVPELVRSLLDDDDRLAAHGRGDARRRAAGRCRARSPTSSSRWRADERAGELWFVGIGGAGLSAYAQLARALGRRGRGLGPRAHAVPRRRSATCELEISAEPVVPRRMGGGRLVGVPVGAGAAACGVPARARLRPSRRSSSPGRTARARRPAMIAYRPARDRAAIRRG